MKELNTELKVDVLNLKLGWIERKIEIWSKVYNFLSVGIFSAIYAGALNYLMTGEYNPRAYSMCVVICLAFFCFIVWRKRSDFDINLNTIMKSLEYRLLYIVLCVFSIALHYLITGEYSPRTYSALVVFYFFIYHLYLLWDGSRK